MDIVEQVKAAEQKALQEKENARAEVKRLYDSAEISARKKALNMLEAAKKESGRITAKSKEEAAELTAKIKNKSSENIKTLADTAAKNREDAVYLVLSYLQG